MRVCAPVLLLAFAGSPAAAAIPPTAVDPGALRATITRLVAFGTRHTMSETASPERGIGAARGWTQARFAALGAACGCLDVRTPSEVAVGSRLPPAGVVIEDVLAVQRGASDPDRVIVVAAHIDSRVTDVMNHDADAPGANDDGSGVAVVLEAARLLSQRRFPATIVYAVLSGEEQGLYGGKLLANYAHAQGWRVEADLNNDIVGNTTGLNGRHEAGYVRVFAEGTKAVETPAQAARRRYEGGENDSPSRELARFVDGLAATSGMGVRMIDRTDRFGRGGDQVPLLEAGFPAVRITEAVENYDRQHQDLRPGFGDTLAGVDFTYLAGVTRLNVAAIAALASAPAPATGVKIAGAVSDDTTVSWSPALGAARYRVWWRETTAPRWEHVADAGAATTLTLKGVVIDDWLFGVQAVSATGDAGPVEFPGDAGSFVSAP